jgi:hypothetical protein
MKIKWHSAIKVKNKRIAAMVMTQLIAIDLSYYWIGLKSKLKKEFYSLIQAWKSDYMG